jgi:hypothetical protein
MVCDAGGFDVQHSNRGDESDASTLMNLSSGPHPLLLCVDVRLAVKSSDKPRVPHSNHGHRVRFNAIQRPDPPF